MTTIVLSIAAPQDLNTLLVLINEAYRGNHENSWTNESNLVSGQRISSEMLKVLIDQSNVEKSSEILYVAKAKDPKDCEILVGCVGISISNTTIEIGTFAVSPQIQNAGIGTQILLSIEHLILENYPHIQTLRMWVLDQRFELIEFYQRKGYKLTGQLDDYPMEANVGAPMIKVQLLEMRKCINQL